jgi:hypothetical protein
MEAAVRPRVMAAASAASGEEVGEERVELGDAILGHVDRDLLGGGCGGELDSIFTPCLRTDRSKHK